MNDLIAWLCAQLNEDERVARAVEDRSAPWDGQWRNDSDGALRTYNGWVLAHNGGKPYAPGLLDHIALHDPARVLAEVDAKRRIIEAEQDRVVAEGPLPDRMRDLVETDVLRLLALPYADRDGYRAEWRP